MLISMAVVRIFGRQTVVRRILGATKKRTYIGRKTMQNTPGNDLLEQQGTGQPIIFEMPEKHRKNTGHQAGSPIDPIVLL